MIDKIQQHFGFAQMPFGRDLTPAALHRHAAHAQAAARITWTITERTLGVITGEVGTGKTVAARGITTPYLRVKALAARTRDIDDLRLLAGIIGVDSAETALQICGEFFPDEEVPPRAAAVLQELFS